MHRVVDDQPQGQESNDIEKKTFLDWDDEASFLHSFNESAGCDDVHPPTIEQDSTWNPDHFHQQVSSSTAWKENTGQHLSSQEKCIRRLQDIRLSIVDDDDEGDNSHHMTHNKNDDILSWPFEQSPCLMFGMKNGSSTRAHITTSASIVVPNSKLCVKQEQINFSNFIDFMDVESWNGDTPFQGDASTPVGSFPLNYECSHTSSKNNLYLTPIHKRDTKISRKSKLGTAAKACERNVLQNDPMSQQGGTNQSIRKAIVHEEYSTCHNLGLQNPKSSSHGLTTQATLSTHDSPDVGQTRGTVPPNETFDVSCARVCNETRLNERVAKESDKASFRVVVLDASRDAECSSEKLQIQPRDLQGREKQQSLHCDHHCPSGFSRVNLGVESEARDLFSLLQESKEVVTERAFEKKLNRQLLHQLVYKHKLGGLDMGEITTAP